LKREGDITWHKQVISGRVRKSYRLTPKGKKELEEVKKRLQTIVRLVFSE